MSITAALALFFLLAVSSGVYFLAERLRFPYTVLLVAIGTFVLVPLSKTPLFDFVNDFTLTPELLFYFFLPILIFESAYNINIRRFMENVRTISALAIPSLIISAVFIAAVLTWALSFTSFPMPFMVVLLFAALISATDPVAVLALFKEFGAPRRLTLIFEGESIFNDGTAVALFLVVLEIALVGFHGVSSVLDGVATFAMMVVGGIIMGILMGGLFAKAIGWAHKNEFVQITLMIVLAHLTFVLTEFISSHLVLFGHSIHLSAIIATTLAAMLMGNYGRSKIPPHAEEFIEKFWGQFAFLANSLVFILIGLIFASLPFNISEFAVPVIIAILVVAVGRAVSIYPIVALMNRIGGEEPTPTSWTHLLAWGSLRGALAVTMVLLIPDSFTTPGWEYAFTPKEFILALTIGCIFATLFIKATTIKWFMDRLGVGAFTDIEKLEFEEARALIHAHALLRLKDFTQKGYVDPVVAEALIKEHEARYLAACEACAAQGGRGTHSLADRVLRMYAIGIEKQYLKELYAYGEITERVYKRVLGKLAIQHERIDMGTIDDSDLSAFTDQKDVFEQLAHFVYRIVSPRTQVVTPEERYMYYRAQSIIARKVLKEFTLAEERGDEGIFGAEAFARTKMLYERFRKNSQAKMDAVTLESEAGVMHLSGQLARKGVLKIESATLDELYHREMITPKIYIAIRDELEDAAADQG